MSVERGGGLYRLRPEHEADQTWTGADGQGQALPAAAAPDASHVQKPWYRVVLVMASFSLFSVLLSAQLVRYQVFGAIAPTTHGSATATQVDPALPRGTVSDRNGAPLAMDMYTYEVAAAPAAVQDVAPLAQRLAPMLGMDEQTLEQMLQEHKHSAYRHYLPLKEGLGPDVGEAIMAWNTFEVTARPMPRRYYPEGWLACHVLGFVGMKSRVGYYGIEGYYDRFLRATTLAPRFLDQPQGGGDQRSQVAANPPLPQTPFIPSQVQQDLVLTIDRTVQHLVEKALREAIELHRAEGGTVIVLEPRGSAVLAMASWPGFNPNEAHLVQSDSVYINPAISALYEPGSVFKLVTYAAAIEAGTITPESKYVDEDEFVYGQRTIQNWDRLGRGEVTAAEALAKSLNVTAAKVAVDLGREQFYRAVQRFGFGQNSGIELDGEVPGIVKLPGKGAWYPADLATNAFGQGISVTPLQMANAVATIASGGVLYRTHVVHQTVNGDRVSTVQPQALSRAVSAQTARAITQIMVDTVEAMPTARVPGYAVAGKSGTAEIPQTGGYAPEVTIASFAGFFPADDPQFVILVKLDRPQTSVWATHTAAPLFQTIIKELIQLYAIPPDRVRLGGVAGGQP